MNKSLLLIAFLLPAFMSCREAGPTKVTSNNTDTPRPDTAVVPGQPDDTPLIKAPDDLIPAGYVPYDTITGDLNNDGLPDRVLIIKGTEQSRIIIDEYRGEPDRNRRGILVFFQKNGGYNLTLQNLACFSSENEDGGVYYAPELDVEVNNNKLYINYRHGRYGYWSYTFRCKQNDFELIGYDASHNRGPVINREVSINFLTAKKQEKINVNENADSGEEVFEEQWHKLPRKKLLLLSEIRDFDELDLSN